MARRNGQLIRTLRLLQLLDSPSGRCVRELARRSGVSPRTIFRDIAAIREAGLSIAKAEFDEYWHEYRWRLSGKSSAAEDFSSQRKGVA